METRVAIVGGGVAGLGTALALASHGHRSAVFEKRKGQSDIDRGDVVHYGVLPLLTRWGAWQEVERASPVTFHRFRAVDGDGNRLFEADVESLLGSGVRFTSTRHPDITQALERAAEATGLVEFYKGEACERLLVAGGRVLGVATPKREFKAPVTVLATGARSKLRDTFFGSPWTVDYGTAFYNACVPRVPGFETCGYYVLSTSGVMILVPLPHDRLRIGIQFRPRDVHDRPSPASFADLARTIFRPLASQRLAVLEATIYRSGQAWSKRWHIPGAVLVGDAAHVVHPAGGQGMNLAFKDADRLAWHLSSAFGEGVPFLDAACHAYAKERRAEVRRVAVRTHVMGVAAGFRRPELIAARAAVLRITDRYPAVKRSLFSRIVEVR